MTLFSLAQVIPLACLLGHSISSLSLKENSLTFSFGSQLIYFSPLQKNLQLSILVSSSCFSIVSAQPKRVKVISDFSDQSSSSI